MQSVGIVLDKFSMERPADMLSPTRGETRSENRQSGVPAFKEWAIVCDSIARGETSLIFRKGGIAEGRDGFQFKHQSFFLFPTYFHEQIERTRLSHVRDVKPQQDAVAISVFVRSRIRDLGSRLNPVPVPGVVTCFAGVAIGGAVSLR